MQRRRLKQGETVKWRYAQHKARGKVVRKLTSPTRIKGHVARASEAEPQYLVESERNGSQSAHHPETLEPAPAKK